MRASVLWLVAILVVIAVVFKITRPSPTRLYAPAQTSQPTAPATIDWSRRLSISGVHIGMTGRDGLEAANKAIASETNHGAKWDYPQIHLDPSHHIDRVTGHHLELDDQRLLSAEMTRDEVSRSLAIGLMVDPRETPTTSSQAQERWDREGVSVIATWSDRHDIPSLSSVQLSRR